MPRVVFDAVAESHLLHHFEIKFGSHADALGLDEFALAFELGNPFFQFPSDSGHGGPKFVMGRNKLLRRKKRERRERGTGMPGQRVKHADPVDFIAKKLDPHSLVIILSRLNLHHVASDPKLPPAEGDVVALVKHLHDF